MFSLFKKGKKFIEDESQFIVSIDMHSHILPGIDDGSEDIETSLLLVQGLYNIGYRKLIATPHVIGDMYKNNPVTINSALQKLNNACSLKNIDIDISAAAEYMLDDYFLKLLKQKDKLLTVHKNFILTELPYSVEPMNTDEMVFAIITEGYKPILAHPERYFYFHKNYDAFYKLKELGFILQVNLLSITGYYGSSVLKAAKFILEKDLADFVGTDMHHSRHLEALSKNQNKSIINKYFGNREYNNFDIN